MALSSEQRRAAAGAITDPKTETEADLPEWVQNLIKDTMHDPEAVHSNYKHDDD